ncbi:MAG: phospho-sugar mutase [Myxococcales bacterium]|nr:MAG: phospho-sugar mutase [Myxococcales bacterium]
MANTMTVRERALAWADADPDATTAAELRALVASGDEAELNERMGGPLLFGTAGLRGLLGAGESRMNLAVIRRTTAGLAAHLLATDPDVARRGVVVGYDGRRGSLEFARETAGVLAAAGIVAHLFPQLCATPLVAFAVLDLGASAGVMVTASHNPPEYNGYKVYARSGAQIVPPDDEQIAALIAAVGEARAVPCLAPDAARAAGRLVDVPPALIERYFTTTLALQRTPGGRDAVRIVYTPMHGTGDRFARELLARAGFAHVTSVPEQQEPDGRFPTVAFPNPEEPGALDLAFALGRREQAGLILANDPDADRLAVAIADPSRPGGYRQLTGNEVGALLGDYVLRTGDPDPRRLVVTTAVSSPMLRHIAAHHGVAYGEVLTGFKWIANLALVRQARDGARFVFGYEEALGYAIGTAVRDKDGLSAALVFAELAAAAAARGRTVADELERLAREVGLFVSTQRNVTRPGSSGAAEIAATMDALRARPPARIGDRDVVALTDVQRGVRREGGHDHPIDLPASNVLVFELDGGARVVARPSGTEPKIKYYLDLRETVAPGEPFADASARAAARLTALVDAWMAVVAAAT